jgi:deazaflavin-dependent oxidoreductase (nitroreductase family)
MAGFNRTPKWLLRLMHLPPRLGYAIGLGPLLGNLILLLTTTGRKSGKPRITPLQYEELEGKIYLGAALGPKADWFRNIQVHPRVSIRLKSRTFSGTAETIGDPDRIADFLEVRLRRHPAMIKAMLRAEGMRIPPHRSDLVKYASQLTLVAIRPDGSGTG